MCKYCDKLLWGTNDIWEKDNNNYAYLEENGRGGVSLVVHYDGNYVDSLEIPINNCPKCGRDLTDEK